MADDGHIVAVLVCSSILREFVCVCRLLFRSEVLCACDDKLALIGKLGLDKLSTN